MSTFDDPNRESVGLAPIWTGADEVAPQTSPTPAGTSGGFDPGEHTVDEVEEYLEQNPGEYDAVMAAEAAGKNRVTLTGG